MEEVFLVWFWIALVFSISATAMAFAMIIWLALSFLSNLRIDIKPIHDDLKFLCIKVSLPSDEVENVELEKKGGNYAE